MYVKVNHIWNVATRTQKTETMRSWRCENNIRGSISGAENGVQGSIFSVRGPVSGAAAPGLWSVSGERRPKTRGDPGPNICID